MISEDFSFLSFEWDFYNVTKSQTKHGVEWFEVEEVFFNLPLFLADTKHSQEEERYWVLGKTNENKCLHVTYTVRRNLIRVISARHMSRRERKYYEEIQKDTKI